MNNTLFDFFHSLTKEQLLAIADFFLVPVKKNSKKSDIASDIDTHLQTFTYDSISLLPERDLKILSMLCEAGPGVSVQFDYPEILSFVEALELVSMDESDPLFLYLSISKPVYDLVSGVIGRVIRDKEESGEFDQERLILGVLNTYGVLTLKEFVDILFDFIEPDADAEQIGRKTASNPNVRMSQFYSNGEVYIISPSLTDFEEVLERRKKFVRKNTKFKRYTRQEMVDAGSNSPFCCWGTRTKEYADLVAMLTSLGYDRRQVDHTIHHIWCSSQFSDTAAAEEAMFHSVTMMMDLIPTFEQYKNCIDTVVAYANIVPKWLLKGKCPNEAGQLVVNVQVSQEEDFMEEPFAEQPVQPEIPESVSDYYKYSMAVGRTDPDAPCPCGSGRPYRLCHGKFLN